MSDFTNLDLEELARQLVVDEGRNPEYLSVAERSWDWLLEKGFDPYGLSSDELDDLYEQVDKLCRTVEV